MPADRRRYARFRLTDPWQGRLRTSDEVTVESYSDGTMVVIGRVGVRPLTMMLMRRKTSATPGPALVKVLDTQPFVMDHGLQFRMHLQLLDREVSAGDGAEYGDALPALIREVPVRLLDFGRGGVLLETTAPLELGMAGQLDVVAADGSLRSADVRICRMLMLHGSAIVCRAGAEFLPSQENGNPTLREVLGAMQPHERSTLGRM